MKKSNTLIVLGLFVLLVGAAQPAYASRYAFGEKEIFMVASFQAAQVNAAISKYEGVLNAYSANQNPEVEKQIFVAADDLSASLEEFNTALVEAYPTLTEEKQLAVRNAYSSLGGYLEDLAAEANSVLGRAVFVTYEDIEPTPTIPLRSFVTAGGS